MVGDIFSAALSYILPPLPLRKLLVEYGKQTPCLWQISENCLELNILW